MLTGKIQLASRALYLRLFGARSDISSDYDAAAKTYDSYYSQNLIRASQPYIAKVPVAQGLMVADLACGTGFFTHILAERTGSSGKIIAADISPGMLECNQKEAVVKGLSNIEFVLSDAIKCLQKLPDSSLDLINIGWGICYMDHKALLVEVLRVLKGGGYLSIIENKVSTLRDVSKHFEHVLTKHPQSLRKHMDINLPRDGAYLAKAFTSGTKLTMIDCYDGSVDVPCKNAAEIAEYMIRSGASSGFLDALEPDQIDQVMNTFVQEAERRAENGKGLPKVVHEFAVLIGKKP